jgi:hypothetical protein
VVTDKNQNIRHPYHTSGLLAVLAAFQHNEMIANNKTANTGDSILVSSGVAASNNDTDTRRNVTYVMQNRILRI